MISHQPSLDHPSLIAPIQRVYASGGPNLPTEISSRFCASERRSSWTVGKEVSEDILKTKKVERSPQPQKWRALHFLAPKVAQSPLLSPKSGTHTMCPHSSLQTQFAHMYISHSQLPNTCHTPFCPDISPVCFVPHLYGSSVFSCSLPHGGRRSQPMGAGKSPRTLFPICGDPISPICQKSYFLLFNTHSLDVSHPLCPYIMI